MQKINNRVMSDKATLENKGRSEVAGVKALIVRAFQIFRAALRGYCMGQPINESRPRKGCC
jgi:hypothetical protein